MINASHFASSNPLRAPALLSASELARRAGSNASTVLRMIHGGEIRPQAQVGKVLLFSPADVGRVRGILADRHHTPLLDVENGPQVAEATPQGGMGE